MKFPAKLIIASDILGIFFEIENSLKVMIAIQTVLFFQLQKTSFEKDDFRLIPCLTQHEKSKSYSHARLTETSSPQ